MITLVYPTLAMKDAAMEYVREHIDHGESHIHGCGGLDTCASYEQWIEKTDADRNRTESSPTRVPATMFFGVRESDGRIVGTIQVRHTLNDYLYQFGGHIGYGVRPSERGKGYASQMLKTALGKAREIGLTRVLITCDKQNIASAKTITGQGGVLENEVMQGDQPVQRYWIEL